MVDFQTKVSISRWLILKKLQWVIFDLDFGMRSKPVKNTEKHRKGLKFFNMLICQSRSQEVAALS